MTPDEILMTHVRDVHGAFIADAVKDTPYPAALVAAIDANETGGDATKSRFESSVFGKLAKVVVGQSANYGSIGAIDIGKWCQPSTRAFPDALLALINLATSWGPTQIMGYQALAGEFPLSQLTDPKFHFGHMVNMLEDFEKRWKLPGLTAPGLILTDESVEGFLRCWNSGSPTGVTTDPQYVPNGLLRMKIYQQLEAA